jgi:hypothetical protein
MDQDQRFASMTVFKALPPDSIRLDKMGVYHGLFSQSAAVWCIGNLALLR